MGGEGHFVPAQFYFDNLELQGVTGIGEGAQNETFSVYPNPASDFIYLENLNNYKHIIIYNSGGQSVYSSAVKDNKIDASDLNKGLYIINILTENGEYLSSRFIKK